MISHAAKLGREIALFALTAISVYLFLALGTYNHDDPGWSHSTPTDQVSNAAGLVGAWFADIFLYLFGFVAFLVPLLVGVFAWLVFRGRRAEWNPDWHLILLRVTGLFMVVFAGGALSAMHFGVISGEMPTDSGGGVLGDLIAHAMVAMFNFTGGTLFLLVIFLIGITLATGLSWLGVMDRVGGIVLMLWAKGLALIESKREAIESAKIRKERTEKVEQKRVKTTKKPAPKIEPVISSLETGVRIEEEKQLDLVEMVQPVASLPPLTLLDEPKPSEGGYSPEALKAMAQQVEVKLLDFGVEVTVQGIQPGPVITRFELQPAPGVKVSKITNLAKDLARSLSVLSVRVVEVIPGKSFIGLEIPNERREMIFLSEMMRSREFESSKATLPLALGKDIGGKPVVADMAKMPHLLVAGTTGSGKSVGVNAMILSLLYRCQPDQVRLIMIDPKMLELSVYEGIPHLLAPVVTDMKEASNALRWCVAEMERRYKLMAAVGVRNLAGYNRKIKEAADKGEPIPDPLFNPSEHFEGEAAIVPPLETMASIVVVVDEFADMMMVVGKKVEELIARLAQKARAAGIHLILATQRPSVDVITGLIKANIPSRIAFQVSSRVDSRTILDQMGAEHLLGHGDMLYLPGGKSVPERVHGAFVDDHEVHAVAQHLCATGEPDYIDDILEGGGDSDAAIPGIDPVQKSDEDDPLYDEAVAIVTETRRASISGVQRRLKIGYNRAARLVEAMEMAGVVGPQESNGNREVLAPPPPKD